MNIHKSHSKKDLLSILHSLNIHLDSKLSKRELIERFPDSVRQAEYNPSIPNLTTLLEILKTPSLKKRLSVDKKIIVMNKSKKIINFCLNHYLFNEAYSSNEQVNNDAIFIHHYGDIPTVRRALRLYNQYNNKIGQVNPVISLDIQHVISEKEKIKEMKTPKYKCSKGKFQVLFN